jgi:acetyl-CoA acetyltransferase family protein
MLEAFIVSGIRTPIGNFTGALSPVRADDLAAHVIKALIAAHPGLDPSAIADVILGCANQAGEDNRNVARMAGLLAGLPVTVPGQTVNRLCASGLAAVVEADRAIRTGNGDLMIAGGVEQMTRAPYVMSKAATPYARNVEMFDTTMGWRFVNPRMKEQHGVDSMGETAENVAEKYNISREDQDRFALASQQKAASARARGRFAGEVVAVEIPQPKGQRSYSIRTSSCVRRPAWRLLEG